MKILDNISIKALIEHPWAQMLIAIGVSAVLVGYSFSLIAESLSKNGARILKLIERLISSSRARPGATGQATSGDGPNNESNALFATSKKLRQAFKRLAIFGTVTMLGCVMALAMTPGPPSIATIAMTGIALTVWGVSLVVTHITFMVLLLLDLWVGYLLCDEATAKEDVLNKV